MPPDPPSRHTHLHVCEHAFTCYYHSATSLFPPPQLKILYETLLCFYILEAIQKLDSGKAWE